MFRSMQLIAYLDSSIKVGRPNEYARHSGVFGLAGVIDVRIAITANPGAD
jgi:hypothetical protein